MEHEILCKPDFAAIRIKLAQGEQVSAEPGAMVAMDSSIKIETAAKGGFLKGLKRAVVGGESFFMNTFTAETGEGSLYLAPAVPGDLHHIVLSGAPFYLQSGAYVASDKSIEVDSKWSGAKTFFGGEGLFMLQCSGEGNLWFSSFGAIHEVDVQGSYIVDTGAIVAFENTLNFNVKSVGGLKSLLFSGEGLVCEFNGTGKLYIQTRQPAGFVSWVNPFRPKKSNNN